MSDDRSDELGAAALEAVGNETRVSIVRALVDHRRENPRDPGLSFSALREESGVRDSGRFNYHLDKLRDRFLEDREGVYTLTYAGRKLATALLAGAYRSGERKGPVQFGECTREDCEAALQATYEDGYLELACEDGHASFRTGLPPAAAAERSMEEILDLVVRTTHQDVTMTNDGICPQCYGKVETSIVEVASDDGNAYGFEGVCQRCGFFHSAPPGICILDHPAVASFYDDHGRTLREEYPWRIDFVMSAESYTCTSADPLELRIDVVLEGEELRVTVDGTGSVLDVERVE